MYNRRKRNAFYKEQHALYAKRLIEAIEAESSGQALDEDQTTIMNRERARVQAEEAKAQRSWGKKIKNVFMGGLKMEEGEEEGGVTAEVVGPVPSEGQILEKLGVDQMTVLKQAGRGAVSGGKVDDAESGHGDGSGIIQAVQEERRENERSMEERGAKGGPLDLMAERALRDVSEKVGEKAGWGSWLGWR